MKIAKSLFILITLVALTACNNSSTTTADSPPLGGGGGGCTLPNYKHLMVGGQDASSNAVNTVFGSTDGQTWSSIGTIATRWHTIDRNDLCASYRF